VFKLGLVTAIISTVITLPILFTFRSRPEGVQEENEVAETKHSQWKEIKLMVKNASFILTTLASSCLMGYFATLTTVLE
jgi:Na+/melibiose symporter-like transporter